MESQAVFQAQTQAKKNSFELPPMAQRIEPVDPVSDGVLADRLERGDGVAVLEEAETAAAADVIICSEIKDAKCSWNSLDTLDVRPLLIKEKCSH